MTNLTPSSMNVLIHPRQRLMWIRRPMSLSTSTKLDSIRISIPMVFPCHCPSMVMPSKSFGLSMMFFYPGTIASVTSDGNHVVNYDDGETETLDLESEVWKPVEVMSAQFSGFPSVASNSPDVLRSIMETLGQKPFMLHHAQGFPQYVITNAYEAEELVFKKFVKCVPKSDVPTDANIISSHTVYKLKVQDDESLCLKARIAPHGNEDSLKSDLKSECSMCSPLGIRVVLTLTAIRRWPIVKADVKSAFLQTGEAQRDVYVRPPRESRDRRHYWLLLAAAYGLVNANAKFQSQADELIMALGLCHMPLIPQLFYLLKNGVIVLVVIKIVDDLLMTGEDASVNDFIERFNKKFELGTVVRGPGSFKFYGISMSQDEDLSSSVNADEKLNLIDSFPLSRVRRRQCNSSLTSVEMSAFMSVNSSIGWLGIAASPFCAFYASHLQQKMPKATVEAIMSQIRYLRLLKQLGTCIVFPSPPRRGSFTVSVLVFSDAGRTVDHGQLSYVAGLLLGPMSEGSLFYTMSWMSHKSKRPVKSIGAAEVLAAAEAIDEGKTLKSAMSILLRMPIRLLIALDSRDLFTSLSTQRNSIDKSIRADVNVIRYEYETINADEIIWIPGRVNLSDPGTKTDSPLAQALQLTMSSGKLSLDLSESESRCADRPLG